MPDTDTATAPKPKHAATADKATKATVRPAHPADKLARLGLHRDIDLVLHLPMRYENETTLLTIAETATRTSADWATQVGGAVTHNKMASRPRRRLVVHIADNSGELVLRFLNFCGDQVKQMTGGMRLRARSEVRGNFFGTKMIHPTMRAAVEDEPPPGRLTSVYPSTADAAQAYLRKAILNALARMPLSEALPSSLIIGPLALLKLMTLAGTTRLLHQSTPDVGEHSLAKHTHPTRLYIKFDEPLSQQPSLRRVQVMHHMRNTPVLHSSGEGGLFARSINVLPFKLINAQARVWDEIRIGLTHPYPAQRLLQGDVGSDKTATTALAACRVTDTGWQATPMTPTEFLAEQHYHKLPAWLEPLGMDIVQLTDSLRHKQKDRTATCMTAGTAQPVIDVYALIQNAVTFARLDLVVANGQRRFGATQWLALRGKASNGDAPAASAQMSHQLMMPTMLVPRTLATTCYINLDISAIGKLPPGRTPIATRLANDTCRDEMIERIYAATREGRRAYWVCPLAEEDEALQLQTAIETFETLL